MLSKNKIKLINSLNRKKNRTEHQLFIVEGKKSVDEFLASHFELDSLYYTKNYSTVTNYNNQYKITIEQLNKISSLKNANQVLAVFHIPKNNISLENGLILALDKVKDPGNLGTIIRLCDWFGIKQLICSLETVDCYNTKVVQASMGSLTRVNIVYTNLTEYINKKPELPVYVSLMDGKNIYKTDLPKNAIIVMGNEANGISDEIITLASNKISIPRFGDLLQTESLNVATATSIILSEFKRFT